MIVRVLSQGHSLSCGILPLRLLGDHGRLLHSNVYWNIDHGSKLHFMEMSAMHCISLELIHSDVLSSGYVQC